MVTQRGGILLPVSFVLAGIAGVIMALNMSLTSVAEMAEENEIPVAQIMCREELNAGLVAIGMNWASGPPYGLDGVTWYQPWAWFTTYQVRRSWVAAVNTEHFPGAIGQIRCEAKTTHGKLVVCNGAVIINNNSGHAVSPTFIRHSLRCTR